MFGPPGRLYVYRSYGIHWCANVVCCEEGVGAAVLLRALEPTAGLDVMRARRGLDDIRLLAAGPGRLTEALDISGAHDGLDVLTSPFTMRPPERSVEVVVSPRVGITRATDRLWRYSLAGSSFVSRPRPRALTRRPGATATPGSGTWRSTVPSRPGAVLATSRILSRFASRCTSARLEPTKFGRMPVLAPSSTKIVTLVVRGEPAAPRVLIHDESGKLSRASRAGTRRSPRAAAPRARPPLRPRSFRRRAARTPRWACSPPPCRVPSPEK